MNDGDIRRLLLKGFNLKSKVSNLYYKKTIYLKKFRKQRINKFFKEK